MVKIRFAVEGDSEFIAKGIIEAERAHTGRGVWDVAFEEQAFPILLQAVLRGGESCNIFYPNFLVAEDELTHEPVGMACSFHYTTMSFTATKSVISGVIREYIPSIPAEQISQMWERIDFLDRCFPEENEHFQYDDSYVLENVFVRDDFRGKGVASELLQSHIQRGRERGCRQCWITCEVGNAAAFRLYLKLGFEDIGHGTCEEATQKIGSEGFHVLRLRL